MRVSRQQALRTGSTKSSIHPNFFPPPTNHHQQTTVHSLSSLQISSRNNSPKKHNNHHHHQYQPPNHYHHHHHHSFRLYFVVISYALLCVSSRTTTQSKVISCVRPKQTFPRQTNHIFSSNGFQHKHRCHYHHCQLANQQRKVYFIHHQEFPKHTKKKV